MSRMRSDKDSSMSKTFLCVHVYLSVRSFTNNFHLEEWSSFTWKGLLLGPVLCMLNERNRVCLYRRRRRVSSERIQLFFFLSDDSLLYNVDLCSVHRTRLGTFSYFFPVRRERERENEKPSKLVHSSFILSVRWSPSIDIAFELVANTTPANLYVTNRH